MNGVRRNFGERRENEAAQVHSRVRQCQKRSLHLQIAEKQSGKELDWFFEVYLRQPHLPKLIAETKGNQLILRWETPNNLPFPMPIEVSIGGATKRYEMPNGTVTIPLPQDVKYVIDPNGWVLKAQ